MKVWSLIVALGITIIFARPGESAAGEVLIDFESDSPGHKHDGFTSVDSPIVHFSDTEPSGSALWVEDFENQSDGQALGQLQDGPFFIVIDLDVDATSISLDFGNDDPDYSNEGDEAVLRVFKDGAPVGESRVVMNRNDLMDQTISFEGASFNRATFSYEVTTEGLAEIIDNVRIVADLCGDGFVQTGEACDAGAQNGSPGSCCSATCEIVTGASCDDGDACTVDDVCDAEGFCAGQSFTCDDGNPCNGLETCDPERGCTSGIPPSSCCTSDDDCFDPCLTGRVCDLGSGQCSEGFPVDCDDGNPCTDDSCNPSSGCMNVNNSAPCDDGDACTQTDTCEVGACVGSDPVVCEATDQCHDIGMCNPETGECDDPWKADGTACSDGDPCTAGDECQQGECVPGSPVLQGPLADPDQTLRCLRGVAGSLM